MAVPLTNDGASFLAQAIGVGSYAIFTIVAASVIWIILKVTIGLRPSLEDEAMGLDKAEVGLEAYPEWGTGSQKF
jgi:Amt family ammonium transporter